MTICKDIRDLLPLWAGDDLCDEESRIVRDHLATCRACAAAAESWRLDLSSTIAAVSADMPPPLPEGFLEQAVAAATPEVRPRFRPWTALQPLAAAAVLLALLWWHPLERTGSSVDGLAWQDVQDAFQGCLEEPVPLSEWSAPEGAGVVAVLKREGRGRGYVLKDCLEGNDLAAWNRYPWLSQRMRALEDEGGEVLVAVCRDGAEDRSRRRQMRRTALAELQ